MLRVTFSLYKLLRMPTSKLNIRINEQTPISAHSIACSSLVFQTSLKLHDTLSKTTYCSIYAGAFMIKFVALTPAVGVTIHDAKWLTFFRLYSILIPRHLWFVLNSKLHSVGTVIWRSTHPCMTHQPCREPWLRPRRQECDRRPAFQQNLSDWAHLGQSLWNQSFDSPPAGALWLAPWQPAKSIACINNMRTSSTPGVLELLSIESPFAILARIVHHLQELVWAIRCPDAQLLQQLHKEAAKSFECPR